MSDRRPAMAALRPAIAARLPDTDRRQAITTRHRPITATAITMGPIGDGAIATGIGGDVDKAHIPLRQSRMERRRLRARSQLRPVTYGRHGDIFRLPCGARMNLRLGRPTHANRFGLRKMEP